MSVCKKLYELFYYYYFLYYAKKYILHRNLDNIPEILTMMKSLQLDYSVNTYTAIARAYGWNKKNQQLIKEMNTAVKNGITFGEVHIMDIVKTLAFVGNHVSIPEVTYLHIS